jgi:hypothetical protein
MNYRRSSQNHAGTDRWRQEHRANLLRWLPTAVVDSERSLNYVLLHGDDSLGTGWSPSWLPRPAALAFLQFLESEFVVQTGYDIFRELRRRALEP